MLLPLAGRGPERSPATETSELPEHVLTSFRVVVLPEGLSGNVSYLSYNLPQPQIGEEVVRMGGATLESGSPLAMMTLGSKNGEPPLVKGFVSGTGEQSLQAPFGCNTMQPLNDQIKVILVAECTIKPGVSIQVSTNEPGGIPGGQTAIYDFAQLSNAPKLETLAVRLPAVTDHKMSAVETTLADVWRDNLGREFGNLGAVVLGWKDGEARGITLANNTDGQEVSLQTGAGCRPDPTSDMRGLTALFLRDQVLQPQAQTLEFRENDLPGGEPGEIYTLDIGLFAQAAAYLRQTYLPLVTR